MASKSINRWTLKIIDPSLELEYFNYQLTNVVFRMKIFYGLLSIIYIINLIMILAYGKYASWEMLILNIVTIVFLLLTIAILFFFPTFFNIINFIMQCYVMALLSYITGSSDLQIYLLNSMGGTMQGIIMCYLSFYGIAGTNFTIKFI